MNIKTLLTTLGLAAFLVAQLCYSIGFIHNIMDGGPSRGDLIAALIAVVLAAYAYFFADMLFPKVDEGIAIPVGVYAGAIGLMGATAAFRLGRTYLRSYLMVLAGALLFITSDSLKTLPVGLQLLVFGDIYPWGQLMAASLMMAIPVVIVYIYAQRYLVGGLTAGSVKG